MIGRAPRCSTRMLPSAPGRGGHDLAEVPGRGRAGDRGGRVRPRRRLRVRGRCRRLGRSAAERSRQAEDRRREDEQADEAQWLAHVTPPGQESAPQHGAGSCRDSMEPPHLSADWVGTAPMPLYICADEIARRSFVRCSRKGVSGCPSILNGGSILFNALRSISLRVSRSGHGVIATRRFSLIHVDTFRLSSGRSRPGLATRRFSGPARIAESVSRNVDDDAFPPM